jgi:hypothetical protein
VLEPDGRKLLPPGWSPPPGPTEMTATFETWPGRGPAGMWMAPLLLDDNGDVRIYIAAGPAGEPASRAHLNRITMRPPLPDARVHLPTGRGRDGQIVFLQVSQTPN